MKRGNECTMAHFNIGHLFVAVIWESTAGREILMYNCSQTFLSRYGPKKTRVLPSQFLSLPHPSR